MFAFQLVPRVPSNTKVFSFRTSVSSVFAHVNSNWSCVYTHACVCTDRNNWNPGAASWERGRGFAAQRWRGKSPFQLIKQRPSALASAHVFICGRQTYAFDIKRQQCDFNLQPSGLFKRALHCVEFDWNGRNSHQLFEINVRELQSDLFAFEIILKKV